jgi:hypothetical protein
MSQTLNLTLSLDKTNLILAGLGELPAEISQILILKIQGDAKKQIKPIEGDKIDPKQELSFEFTLEEINLVLQGLGKLPAKMSMQLIIEIQEIAQKQLDKSNSNSKTIESEPKMEPKTEPKFSDFNEPKLEHKIEEKLEHKPTHIDVSTHEQN